MIGIMNNEQWYEYVGTTVRRRIQSCMLFCYIAICRIQNGIEST